MQPVREARVGLRALQPKAYAPKYALSLSVPPCLSPVCGMPVMQGHPVAPYPLSPPCLSPTSCRTLFFWTQINTVQSATKPCGGEFVWNILKW